MTRKVQASEAKTHLPRLLDDVERGETIIITRHGRPIARIVPEAHRRQQEIDRALADIQELRERTGKVSIEEILAWRHPRFGPSRTSATLRDAELRELTQRACAQVRGRVAVIAGAGTSSTAGTVERVGWLSQLPIDGLLLVTPAYNRPTQEGLYLHFTAAAAAAPSTRAAESRSAAPDD